MSATVFTAEEAKKANIELITEEAKGRQAVHDVVVAMRANRRRGTASTKTKADVALSGAKPWRQKGTGRARAGYKGSPVWTHGGVAFAPKPRSYRYTMNRKEKRIALKSALSVKAAESKIGTRKAMAPRATAMPAAIPPARSTISQSPQL